MDDLNEKEFGETPTKDSSVPDHSVIRNLEFVDLYASKLIRGEIVTPAEKEAWNEIRIAAKKLRGEELEPSEAELWAKIGSLELEDLGKEVNDILDPARQVAGDSASG